MPDLSQATVSTQRPVTPLSIIAQNLDRLVARAASLSLLDAAFFELLAHTARLAGGLDGYLVQSSSPASPLLAELAADTERQNWKQLHADGVTAIELESEMLSGHLEGRLLNMLVRATRATRILEIGCFTGYSALAMAEALPAGGLLVACELDAYAARVARTWFDRSPRADNIRIEVGPAIDTVRRLRDDGASFDFVFIDADKAQYAAYLDLIVGSELLTPNGLICVDNTLMQGAPYLGTPRTPNGTAIAEFNRIVAADPRVEQVLLPVRDGVTLIRRAS